MVTITILKQDYLYAQAWDRNERERERVRKKKRIHHFSLVQAKGQSLAARPLSPTLASYRLSISRLIKGGEHVACCRGRKRERESQQPISS